MKKCLELAKKGMEYVSPNPMVGCVVVFNDQIIGEGYHQEYGAAHAEVNAIKSTRKNLKNSSIYISLEPCSHYGKTHPCTKAIIKSKIKKVFYAIDDVDARSSKKAYYILKRK